MSSADRDGTSRDPRPRGPESLLWKLPSGRKILLAGLAAIYLGLLAAPLAVLVQEHDVQRQVNEYLSGEDRGSLFRSEVEYLATLNVLYQAQAGAPGVDRAAVQEAIDLLYSRYDILKGRAVATGFGGLPAYDVLMTALERAIAAADGVLAGETGPRVSPEGLEAMIREIRAVEEPLRTLLRDALRQSARHRDTLRAQADSQAVFHRIATVALVVASVGFIGALAWYIRQLRMAGRRLGRLADAVKQSETRLRLITDNLPMLIGYVEADRRMLFLNRTGETWSGVTSEAAIGRSISALFGAEEGQDVVGPRIAEASAGRVVQFESRLSFPDGVARIVDGSFIPDFAADGRIRGFFVLMIDITARRDSEGLLRQALKMEAVGRLTGGIAHDFNNLLGVIVGNLDLVDAELAGRPRELVRRALGAAERGAALTQRLLAFSRRQMLTPRSTDVNRLIAELADTLLPMLGEQIEIVAVPCPEQCMAFVDANQLEAAILNLAVNARDAMPEGGRLTIATSIARLGDEDAARLSDVMPGEYVTVTVTDTGQGMSAEVAGRAFEPFFTTKDVGKGSGLGLSMVFGFVKQSGGHVELHSQPGAGTALVLFLPRAATAAPGEAGFVEPAAAGAETGRLILVVEDNRDLLAFSVSALQRLGYRTIQAEDAATALALLERTPGVELLFTDIVLPGGMDGVALATEVRRRRPALKILFTSGYIAGDPRGAAALPADADLLVKPFRVGELGDRLDRIFGSER